MLEEHLHTAHYELRGVVYWKPFLERVIIVYLRSRISNASPHSDNKGYKDPWENAPIQRLAVVAYNSGEKELGRTKGSMANPNGNATSFAISAFELHTTHVSC